MKRTAIPRYQRFDGPILFRHGFRPFFLSAGIWAMLSMVLWLAMLMGWASLPTTFAPVDWHAHEMIFGFAGAAVAGFLLTAVPNWTGRMPLQGAPLIALFCAWLVGRVAMAMSAVIGPLPSMVLDLSFLVLLGLALTREIVSGRNWRNLPVLLALAFLIAANLLTHLEALGIADTGQAGQRAGIAVLVGLISLIGGRIIPSFTRNWLIKRGEEVMPLPFSGVDRVAIALTAAGLLVWVLAPETPITGGLLLVAGVAGFVRLGRWRGHRTFSEPMVWSLHLGFLWVPAGLTALGAGILWPSVFPATAAVHALGAGAVGTMVLAVMTRATLGHTGRPTEADRPTAAIYILVAAAAAARVVAALGVGAYEPLLWLAAAAWIGAFGLFSIHYGASLVGRSANR